MTVVLLEMALILASLELSSFYISFVFFVKKKKKELSFGISSH